MRYANACSKCRSAKEDDQNATVIDMISEGL
jgi:hypothetical protein